jgi:SAM-dependent methyltransferase/uncharacterized protein YbaR (Trm112 family)
MKAAARALLTCPFCTGAIRTKSVTEGSEASIRYGILHCVRCNFEYPIIAGVGLILGPDEFVDIKAETTAHTLFGGPQVRDLVELVKSGANTQALALLLGPTGAKGNLLPELRILEPQNSDMPGLRKNHPPIVNREVRLRRGGRLVRAVQAFRRKRTLPGAQFRLAQYLETHRDQLSAMDVIDLFYRQYSGVETANYFAFRFGQPRHLAALSLGSLFHQTTGPILDVACGLGHLTHAFTQGHPTRPVIGLDRDFFRLYVASEFVAPDASYLCAPADQPLPFANGTFGGVFCSDAFHYFLYRAASVREFQRKLASDGVLVLCRFGNAEVQPREGYELTIDGYRLLLSDWPHVMLGEDDLVERYLEKRGPDLAVQGGPAELRQQKWLSIVAARSLDRLGPEQRFATWPHALGRLQLNPIYLEDSSQPGGETALRFEFPSSWYEFENQRYLGYAPRQARITHAAWAALKEGRPSPVLQEYVDQFVILGMPERYASPKIQPAAKT